MQRLLKYALQISISIISFVASFILAYQDVPSGYEKMFVLPLVYGIVFPLFLAPILMKKTNLFIVTFTLVSFSRYIILPLLMVKSGWYFGRSPVAPLPASIDLAIKLMAYEALIVSVVIFLLFRKKSNTFKHDTPVKLPRNNAIYIIFILFTLGLTLLQPSSLRSFSFIIPSENIQGIGNESFLTSLVTYCLITSKYLITFILLSYFYKKYQDHNNYIYVFFSLVILLLNISILFGDNRSDFIINTIVSVFLFYKLYPKESKFGIYAFIITMLLITSFITEHRNYASPTKGDNKLVDMTDTFQVYLGGPYNVALATELNDLFPQSDKVSNLMYDFLRPAIGLNFLLKNVEGFEFSNYLFNYRVYFTDHTAQIIPMIGQGYFYLGFIFSPLLILIFIFTVKILINLVLKTNRMELIYFLSIPIARIGFAMGQNVSILVNDTTFFLLLNLTIYYLNNQFRLPLRSK